MTPGEVLVGLRQRGIVLVPWTDGRLRYRPRDGLTATEQKALADHRDAIVRFLEADPVAWREAVMATQMTSHGAIPLLLARPGARFASGCCSSCGDPLGPGDRYRCAPCAEAATRVVGSVP